MNNKWLKIKNYIADDNLRKKDIYTNSLKNISNAESKLNLTFSKDYKKFLQLYDSAFFEGFIVYGLIKQPGMSDNLYSVVQNTKFYKEQQKWPGIDDWYIISDDGFGNPIGIDKEGKVWLSDHDSNFEHIKIADSFEEFLEKLIDETVFE